MRGKELFDRKARVLVIITLCVAFLFAFAGYLVVAEFEDEKFQERSIMVDRILNVYVADTIQQLVYANNDWHTYNYDFVVTNIISRINQEHISYAAAFRLYSGEGNDKHAETQMIDGNRYVVLSKRATAIDDEKFDPLSYSGFVNKIMDSYHNKNEAKGHDYLKFNTKTGQVTMYVTYRWVPIPDSVDNPYLIMVAINRFNVETPMANWIVFLFAMMIVAIVALPIAYVAFAKNRMLGGVKRA